MKNNKNTRYTILVLLASLVTPFASAQVAGAVDAATRTTVAPPQPPPTPRVDIGVQGSAAANAASRPAAVDSKASAAGSVKTDRPASADIGVNSQATTNASAKGQERGLSVASTVSGSAATSLNVAEVVHEIRGTTFATREKVSTEIDARIDATAAALRELRKSARELKAEARGTADAAFDDVKAKEKALKESLKEARKASESTWTEAQSKLAVDYDAYAQAVANAEAALQASSAVETAK